MSEQTSQEVKDYFLKRSTLRGIVEKKDLKQGDRIYLRDSMGRQLSITIAPEEYEELLSLQEEIKELRKANKKLKEQLENNE